MKNEAATPVAPTQAAPKEIAFGLLLAAFGSIAFSGKAIIVKLAYRYGVDAVTLIMYRMLFALPLNAMEPKAANSRPIAIPLGAACADGTGVTALFFIYFYFLWQ